MAILFVVVNHLGAKPEVFNWKPVVMSTSPVMACISSFLLFRSLTQPRDLIYKIKYRIRSLILPYFLWTFIAFLIWQTVKTFTSISSLNILAMKRPFPDWSFYEYWNNFVIYCNPGAFWYLQNLILILPFTIIIYYLVKRKWNIIFLMFIVVMGYHIHLIPYFSVRFLPYYIYGAWLGVHFSEGPPVLIWNRYLLICLLVSLLIGNEYIPGNLGIYQLIIEILIQIGIFIISINTIYQFKNTFIIEYFYKKMHISFYLHASHELFILIIINLIFVSMKYFKTLSIYETYIHIVYPFIVFLLTYKLIEVLANQMREKTPELYGALSGGRHAPKSPQRFAEGDVGD